MAEPGESLSQRELEVLRCLAEGASNKEIAQRLVISPNTVKVHLRNAFAKLGASSRVDALVRARQLGLLAGDAPIIEAGWEKEEEEEGADSAEIPPIPLPSPPTAPPRRRLFLAALVLVALFLLWATWRALVRQPNNAPAVNSTLTFSPAETDTPLGVSRWSRTHPLPFPRAGMSVAGIGPEIYVISGRTTTTLTNGVLIYDTRRRAWRDAAPKPTAVQNSGSAVLDGQIYVVGGSLATDEPVAVVEAYSPANDAWRSVAALPEPIAGGLALADNGLLYLFGGWNGQKALNTTYVYDPNVDSWRPLAPLAHARAYLSGGVLETGMLAVGGFDGRNDLAWCEHFSPATGVWRTCPEMLVARGGAGAAVVLNKLYVIGGGLSGALPYAEFYDPNSQTWQVLNLPMLNGPERWTYLGVATVETHLYTLGGERAGEISAENYLFSPLYYQYIPAAPGNDNG